MASVLLRQRIEAVSARRGRQSRGQASLASLLLATHPSRLRNMSTYFDPHYDADALSFDLDLDDHEQHIEQSQRRKGRRGRKGRNSVYRPAMDRFEKEGKVIITVELAGLTKKDVDLSLHDNTLVINGSTLHLKESSDETTHVQTERHYSPFSRSIRLPHGLQDNEITASMEHGLLKLELPKQPKEGHGVKIEIA